MQIKVPKKLLARLNEALNNHTLSFTTDDAQYEIIDYTNMNQTILLKDMNQKQIIKALDDIVFFHVLDGYTYAFDGKKDYSTPMKLYEISNHHFNGFIQINKSTILNVAYVLELKTIPFGKVELTIKQNQTLVVSRYYNLAFKEYFEKWVYKHD